MVLEVLRDAGRDTPCMPEKVSPVEVHVGERAPALRVPVFPPAESVSWVPEPSRKR